MISRSVESASARARASAPVRTFSSIPLSKVADLASPYVAFHLRTAHRNILYVTLSSPPVPTGLIKVQI
eukprot:1846027-Amphidinium_carterae.1